ncbi:MAG: flagellar biosynthetic protein FliR, partial [Alphaproteobacteria bacterium]|nr:flagellar biosynthetic protein FliR [Alphaproteobacteria bacterium]
MTLPLVAHDAAWMAALVFFRVGAAMAFLPAFGERSVPARVKLVVALAFTLAVTPLVLPVAPERPKDVFDFGFALLAETLVGLFLGFVMRSFLFALQIAGSIAAQSTSLSQIFASGGADPLPAMGHMLTMG